MPQWARVAREGLGARWPSGPVAIPPATAAAAARLLDPTVILAALGHHLLASPLGDNLGVECLAADRQGISRAAEVIGARAGDGVPVLLVFDANGSTMQTLLHELDTTGRNADVVCIASRATDGMGRVNGPAVALLAHAQWGGRVLGRAQHLTAVGRPTLGAGSHTARRQTLAAEFHVRPAAVRPLDPPECVCAWQDDDGGTATDVSVLAGMSTHELTRGPVEACQKEATRRGVSIQWHTDRIAPGAAPRQHGADVEPMVRHTLAGTGDGARALLAALRRELEALEAEGQCIVWSSRDLDGAIHIPAPPASCPAMVAALRPPLEALGGKPAMVAGGVAVLGVLPALADATLESAGIQEWTRAAFPPRRLHFATGNAGYGQGCGQFRLSQPGEGHELTWLVHTGGQWSEARVGAALQGALGRAVFVTAVEARVPGGDTYDDMLMVRLPDATATEALRCLASGAGGLRVGDAALDVFPVTQLRHVQRGGVEESTGARRLWNAAATHGRAGAGRSTTYHTTAIRTPTDAGGDATGPGVAVTLSANPGEWGGDPRRTEGFSLTHAFLGSEVAARFLGAGGSEPGAPPPALCEETAEGAVAPIRGRTPAARGIERVPLGDGQHYTWAGTARPGEALLVAVAAGGLVRIGGPGENVEVRILRPAWVRVLQPPAASVRAGEAGVNSALTIRVEQAVELWELRARTRPRAPRAARADGGTPTVPRGTAQSRANASGQAGGASGPRRPPALQGLRGWLTQRLQDTSPMEPPDPAVRAGVEAVLGDMAEVIPPGALDSCAAWAVQHASARQLRGATGPWQWPVALLTWLLQQAGIVSLLRTDPGLAEELLSEADFVATVRRQTPCRQWMQGREGCAAGAVFPGERAETEAAAQRLARTCLRFPQEACHALTRACTAAAQSTEGGGGPLRKVWPQPRARELAARHQRGHPRGRGPSERPPPGPPGRRPQAARTATHQWRWRPARRLGAGTLAHVTTRARGATPRAAAARAATRPLWTVARTPGPAGKGSQTADKSAPQKKGGASTGPANGVGMMRPKELPRGPDPHADAWTTTAPGEGRRGRGTRAAPVTDRDPGTQGLEGPRRTRRMPRSATR